MWTIIPSQHVVSDLMFFLWIAFRIWVLRPEKCTSLDSDELL